MKNKYMFFLLFWLFLVILSIVFQIALALGLLRLAN